MRARRGRHRVAWLALHAALLLAPVAAAAASVSGRVVFSGEVPPPVTIEVTKDQDACGPRVDAEALVVSPATRGVRHAVVFVEGVHEAPASAPAEVTLQNQRCRFVPHVLAARVGAELAVVNADAVLHNLRAWLDGRALLNVVQPTQGQVTRRALKRAGVMTLTCDAHAHMHGYLLAFDHPYFAVTDAEGGFTIPGVPPGTRRLSIWHEGWTVTRRESNGRLVWSAPRVLSRDVLVPERGTVTVTVDLATDR